MIDRRPSSVPSPVLSSSILLRNLSDHLNNAIDISLRHLRIYRQRNNTPISLSCVWEIFRCVAERTAIVRMQVQRNEVNRSADPPLVQSLNELITSDP